MSILPRMKLTAGTLLFFRRKELGLTQTKLAQLARISIDTLQLYEFDRARRPNVKTLKKLEDILGLPRGALILLA